MSETNISTKQSAKSPSREREVLLMSYGCNYGNEDDDYEEETWAELPDLLLEEIFLMLAHRWRNYCSQVCKHWYDVFQTPRLWRKLVISENSFTYRRFNLYRGYQLDIHHGRFQMCLKSIGHHVKHLVIKENPNYHNLGEILRVLETFLNFFDEYPMPNLHIFHFTFGCETRDVEGSTIIGTGGQMLGSVKRVLSSLQDLTSLTVNELHLDVRDAPGLLDSVVRKCGVSLEYLEVINVTKDRYPLFYAAMFCNLRMLAISPQQLTHDVLMHLLHGTLMEDLVIVQNQFTMSTETISHMTWFDVKSIKPELRVHLELRGKIKEDQLLIQERAPVKSVIFDSRWSCSTPELILQITEHYNKSLRVFGHLGVPRVHTSRSFHDRADCSLVLLIRDCPNIRVLYIRERVSTATLLIIASEAKNLKYLYVRRNGVIKRCDWPRAAHWTDDFYTWLKRCSQDYSTVEQEISQIMETKWNMLSDKEYMRLKVHDKDSAIYR